MWAYLCSQRQLLCGTDCSGLVASYILVTCLVVAAAWLALRNDRWTGTSAIVQCTVQVHARRMAFWLWQYLTYQQVTVDQLYVCFVFIPGMACCSVGQPRSSGTGPGPHGPVQCWYAQAPSPSRCGWYVSISRIVQQINILSIIKQVNRARSTHLESLSVLGQLAVCLGCHQLKTQLLS